MSNVSIINILVAAAYKAYKKKKMREQLEKEKQQEDMKKKEQELERKLRVEYAREKVMDQLEEQGFKVSEEQIKEDGTVELVAARWTGK